MQNDALHFIIDATYIGSIELFPWNDPMLRQINDRLQNYRRTRQSIRYLQQLDDHSLADIGLIRGDIRRAVMFGR